MNYAKLVDGKVEFAPLNKGAILNYNKNEEMMLSDGYKHFIKSEQETSERMYHIEYETTNTELRSF